MRCSLSRLRSHGCMAPGRLLSIRNAAKRPTRSKPKNTVAEQNAGKVGKAIEGRMREEGKANARQPPRVTRSRVEKKKRRKKQPLTALPSARSTSPSTPAAHPSPPNPPRAPRAPPPPARTTRGTRPPATAPSSLLYSHIRSLALSRAANAPHHTPRRPHRHTAGHAGLPRRARAAARGAPGIVRARARRVSAGARAARGVPEGAVGREARLFIGDGAVSNGRIVAGRGSATATGRRRRPHALGRPRVRVGVDVYVHVRVCRKQSVEGRKERSK
ncbi:hypothetical protein B0H10DRAFT_522183 [Mycena sp. CBHHK59/15]|nr:hypothetical protein B0H10DRAFT_522183 [Mycena sp. CBHHK59/15]